VSASSFPFKNSSNREEVTKVLSSAPVALVILKYEVGFNFFGNAFENKFYLLYMIN
jgi:hypothetical protein